MDLQNPLASAGQAIQVGNAMYQNRLMQAKQAAGQAFQQSIGPDGTPNQNLLMQNLAGRPDAAMAAQESAQAGQNLASSNLGFNAAQQTGLASVIGSQLTQGDDQQTPQAYQQRIMYARQAGLIDDAHVQAALNNMPPPDSGPQAYRQFGAKLLIGALAGPAVAQQAFGSPVTIANGQTVQGGTQSSPVMGGSITPNGPATPVGYPSRGELGTQLNSVGTDANGNPIPVATTQATRLNQQGAGGALGGPAALDVSAAQTLGTGRPAGPGQSASALPQGAVPTGLAIGSPEAIAADVGKFKTDQAALPAAQTAVQSLQKAQHALELSNTGRGTEAVHDAYAFLQAQGVPTPLLSSTSDVTNYDLAHKYLLDYARSQGAAAKTDLQLQTSEGANASTGISTGAALNVVKTNIGRERQKIAQVTEAPNPNGLGYGAHASAFANATDPRGFAVDSYSPQEVSSMVSSMTPTEKAKFYKSVGIAQRLNLLNVPPPAAAPAAQIAPPTTTINPGPGGA